MYIVFHYLHFDFKQKSIDDKKSIDDIDDWETVSKIDPWIE